MTLMSAAILPVPAGSSWATLPRIHNPTGIASPKKKFGKFGGKSVKFGDSMKFGD